MARSSPITWWWRRMTGLGRWILWNTAWLYTRIYENDLLFLDLWSLAHLWSGFAVMASLLALGIRRRWFWLAALLLGYELLELAFIYRAFHVFRPETLKDQATDMVVGLLGGAVALSLRAWYQRMPRASTRQALLRHFTAVLVALTIAFEWVGNYGYRYDRSAFNSAGLNWWAFLLWSAGLFGIAQAYAGFERRMSHRWAPLGSTAALYLVGLFVVEYLGYVTLQIREVGHGAGRALAFGLVHGTPALHVAYLAAPLFGSLAFVGARAVLCRAFEREPLRKEAAGGALAVRGAP